MNVMLPVVTHAETGNLSTW